MRFAVNHGDGHLIRVGDETNRVLSISPTNTHDAFRILFTLQYERTVDDFARIHNTGFIYQTHGCDRVLQMAVDGTNRLAACTQCSHNN